jgi:hypothetical protein
MASQKDTNYIHQCEHDDETNAKRVILVGGELNPSFEFKDGSKDIIAKLDEISSLYKDLSRETLHELQKPAEPIVIEKLEIKTIETKVPVIETKVVEIPVIVKEIERIEIPVIVKEPVIVEKQVIVEKLVENKAITKLLLAQVIIFGLLLIATILK